MSLKGYTRIHFTVLKKQYDEFVNSLPICPDILQESDLTVTMEFSIAPTNLVEISSHCTKLAIPYSITFLDGMTTPMDFRYDQYGTPHWNGAKASIPPTVDPSFTHQYEYSRLHLLMRIVNT